MIFKLASLSAFAIGLAISGTDAALAQNPTITGIANYADSSHNLMQAAGSGTSTAIPLPQQSLIVITGEGLAANTVAYETTTPGVIPATLGGVTITVGGSNCFPTYVSPDKLICITPLSINDGYLQVVNVGFVSQNVLVNFIQGGAVFVTESFSGNDVPVMTDPAGRQNVGTELTPLVWQKSNPAYGSVTFTLNGGGPFYQYDGKSPQNPFAGGPVPPGTIAYGYCDTLPVITLTSPSGKTQNFTWGNLPDGSGKDHPACKQSGFYTTAVGSFATVPTPGQSGWYLQIDSGAKFPVY